MTEHKFEVVDDYIVKYDGDYFDLHKPSNIRSLVTVANYVVTENERLKHQLAQQEMEYATDLNRLTKDNEKLKQVIQAIITKEFELSSDDNGYDPLSEFFNNEVPISQIEVEINVEKND